MPRNLKKRRMVFISGHVVFVGDSLGLGRPTKRAQTRRLQRVGLSHAEVGKLSGVEENHGFGILLLGDQFGGTRYQVCNSERLLPEIFHIKPFPLFRTEFGMEFHDQ